jgi:hypothetical protein
MADFFESVWAWILDWYWLLLVIGAIAAIIFTKPVKRRERPPDADPPKTPVGGGWGV